MAEPQLDTPLILETDAVVIGAGLAGVSAAIHLARSGFRVICLEQRKEIRNSIGESLDWSAPDLFAELGLEMEDLISSEAATWKRHITVTDTNDERKEYLPGEWLAQSPWNVEIRTLHLDRARTDARLREIAQQLGIITLHERVADFAVLDESDVEMRRVLGLSTAQGTFIRACWFIDASGADACLLGKRFGLKSAVYGPRKVAMWSHLPTEQWAEGTTLYMHNSAGEYMEWIWEIPIRPGTSSVGYVAPGTSVKRQRAMGLSPSEIFARRCRSFPRLRELVDQAGVSDLSTTTFLCRTYEGVCGANWVTIGEAASQSDPITGNGVTAALRHAREAVALMRRYRRRGTIPPLARIAYNRRVLSLGRYFNSLIEKLFYQPALRDRIGLFGTARIYTVPAWLMNLIYTRTRPRGLIRTFVISGALAAIRMAVWVAFFGATILDRRNPRSLQTAMTPREEPSYAM